MKDENPKNKFQMTSKFQLIKILNSKISQSNYFEIGFLSFVAYLFFGFCDLFFDSCDLDIIKRKDS
jgi:hypothetical protein